MLDDLRYIRATLLTALRRFGKTPTGEAWDGNLTNAISPDILAQIIGSLEAKIALLDEWLVGDWTLLEMVVVAEFVTAWHTEELTIERYLNRYDEIPFADLAASALSTFTGHPIPATPIPKRGNKDARTDLIPQNNTDYSGPVQPGPTFEPTQAPGPSEPSSEQ